MSRIVGDDAAFELNAVVIKTVIMRSARQFGARLRFHDHCDNVSRRPAGEQIGVSIIRQKDDFDIRRRVQSGEYLVPEHRVLTTRIILKPQSWPGFRNLSSRENAMSTEIEKNFALAPANHSPPGFLKK